MVGVTPLKVNVTEEIDFDNFSLKLNIPNTRTYAMSPLHELLWQENYEGAESYIQQQIDSGDIGDVLRQYDRDGRSVLMYAIICRNIKIAKMLLEAKAPVNYKTEEGLTALFYAVFYNCKEIVDMLIKQDADLNMQSRTRSPISPLGLACAKGHVQIVAALLKAGAEANAFYDTQGEKFSTLMLTLHSEEITAKPVREAICELLVNAGANTHQPRSDGCTPMMCGIELDMTDFVKLILEKNITRLDVLAADKCTTALWVAMKRRNEEVARLLLEGGASVETGKNRSCPLHAATLYDFPVGTELLLEKGLVPVWMDQAGFTPLHYAACLPDTQSLELILKKPGLNLEIPAKRSGFSPLVVASLKGNIPGMKLLLEHNAKLEAYDKKDGITPLIATIVNNHMDAMKFLLDKGADAMGRRSGNGMTPLMNAIGLQRDEARDIISAYSKEHGKKGEMKKQGGGNRSKGWKKRLFVLYGTYFYYYKAEKQPSPQGIIILDNAKITESVKGPCSLEVVTPARIYYIKADNQDQRDEWFNALTQAVESYNPEQKPSQSFTIEGKAPEIPVQPAKR